MELDNTYMEPITNKYLNLKFRKIMFKQDMALIHCTVQYCTLLALHFNRDSKLFSVFRQRLVFNKYELYDLGTIHPGRTCLLSKNNMHGQPETG